MTRKGGINKTRKAVAKRFKVTGTGKVLRCKQGKRQLAAVKVGSQGKALSVSMGVYVPEDDDLAYRDVFVKADEAHQRP